MFFFPNSFQMFYMDTFNKVKIILNKYGNADFLVFYLVYTLWWYVLADVLADNKGSLFLLLLLLLLHFKCPIMDTFNKVEIILNKHDNADYSVFFCSASSLVFFGVRSQICAHSIEKLKLKIQFISIASLF